MIYGSVCSGIEAASVAWHPLCWKAAFVSEIEAFPRAVLQHHWPETPLHGDFTTIRAGEYAPIDLLVGGTPCQSFSVAGLRGGLDDDRGNLALEYLRLADRLRPRWLVWENVPGVLSSNKGRDFGAILGGMVELGYGFAYRVLDAQFFGVAQRCRRVFVVGHLGDWRRAAAVLFERHSLSGHPAPSRQAREGATGTLEASLGRSRGAGTPLSGITGTLSANGKAAGSATQQDAESGLLVAYQATGDAFWREGLGPLAVSDDNGSNQLIAFSSKDHGADAEFDMCPTLRAGGHDGSHANAGVPPAIAYGLRSDLSRSGEAKTPSVDGAGKARLRDAGFNPLEECAPTLDTGGPHAVAFALRGREGGAMPEVSDGGVSALRAASGGSSRDYVAITPLDMRQASRGEKMTNNRAAGSSGGAPGTGVGEPGDPAPTIASSHVPAIAGSAVRRLTPRECERLQGFSDDYTLIPWRKGLAADGPRYKALGNSMAVPVMAWIGQRIQAVETASQKAAS